MSGSAPSDVSLGWMWTGLTFVLWAIIFITLAVSCVYYWRLWRNPVPNQPVSPTAAASMFVLQMIFLIIIAIYAITSIYRMGSNVTNVYLQSNGIDPNGYAARALRAQAVANGQPLNPSQFVRGGLQPVQYGGDMTAPILRME